MSNFQETFTLIRKEYCCLQKIDPKQIEIKDHELSGWLLWLFVLLLADITIPLATTSKIILSHGYFFAIFYTVDTRPDLTYQKKLNDVMNII